MTTYLYLHGFASSPQSKKAQYLCDRFTEIGINLNIIDLNAGDFSRLTLTRQIEQAKSTFPPDDSPVTIIGSSFGGLTAVWLGEKYPQVRNLILLAPAFGFPLNWLSKLEKTQIKQWQESSYLSVYHYGKQQELLLHYQFITDAQQYDESQLKRVVPTLILHGKNDEVIPIEASFNYADNHPWIKLIELDSDHSLTDVMPEIWRLISAEIRSNF